jgi:hypothetical protein
VSDPRVHLVQALSIDPSDSRTLSRKEAAIGVLQTDRSPAWDSNEERRKLIEALRPHLGSVLVAFDDEPVLSTREVALIFRVCSATVRRWADTGRLEGRRTPGGRWTFPVSGVRRAAEGFSATASGTAGSTPA